MENEVPEIFDIMKIATDFNMTLNETGFLFGLSGLICGVMFSYVLFEGTGN
jgi:hypothetical protein